MNKYQEALNELIITSGEFFSEKENESIKVLQELVEKVTPKKMEKIDEYESFSYYKCPVCHSIVGSTDRYCSNCGQRVDGLELEE